tara:strand:- start:220 stop:543 length:324 start_codon:yes stop_codon:yes gene_type:complete
MTKIIEIKEKRMFNYDLSALQREIDDAISLKKRLLEDLKSECNHIDATEKELKEMQRNPRCGDEGYREDTEYDLKVSQNTKDYLEGVLGVTFIWSEDKEDWIKVKAD